MTELRLLSTLAVQGAIEGRLPTWTQALGVPIVARFGPTKMLLEMLAGGEAADVVILTQEAVAAGTASGRFAQDTVADLALSFVGIAQHPGAPHPDIATPESLVATLLAARSIAYSGAGASGLFFAGLIARLGIAAAVKAKATVIPGGLTGALTMDGRCQYAIQQISELMLVPGIDIIGRLPAALQSPGVFTAACTAPAGAGGRALLALLAAPAMAPAYRAAGLEPAMA